MIRSESQIRTPYAWLTPIILLVAVVVFTIAAISIVYVEDHLIAKTGESLAVAAADIAKMADRILFERYSDIPMISRVAVFRRRDQAAMTEYLATLKKTYPVYVWLGVTDEHGRILAATNPADVGKDRSGREWFQSARDRGRVQVEDAAITENSSGIHAVVFTAPIRGARDEFLGVVMACVSLSAIVDLSVGTIHAMMVQQGSSARIEYQFLTRDGDLIADSLLHEEGKVNLKRRALLSALFSGSAQPGYVEEQHLRRHVPVISGYAQTEGYGEFTGLHWAILVRMDRSDVLASVQANLRRLALAGALVFVPFLGFLLWTTGRLKRQWSRAHLRERAIAAAENGIFITDPSRQDNPIIYVNPAFEGLTGYASAEILGRSYRVLERPDTGQAAVEEIRRALREERECRVVAQNYRRDGTPFWNEMTISPVRDTTGTLTHYVWVLTDITERRRAEEMLERLRRQNELILNSAGEGIYGLDLQGNATFVNPAAARMLGWEVEDLIGKPMHPTLHHSKPDGTPYPEEACPIYAAFQYGTVQYVDDEVFWKKDGTSFPVEYISTPLRERGKMVGAVVTFQDIAERKRAQEALQAERDHSGMIIRNTPAIVCGIAPDGTTTFVNPAGQRLTGYSADELVGRNWWRTFYPGDEYRQVGQLFRDFQKGDVRDYEMVLTTRSGEKRTVSWNSINRFDETGRLLEIIGFGNDVTERKREAEIRALLLEEVITAQEEERRRIARELHDETGQSLTALLVGLRAMEEAHTIKDAQLHARELRRIAALTLDEVGRLARGLHPSALDDLGLAAALERYAAEFEESHRIKVAVHLRNLGLKRLPRPVETALYRIVQEALTNIAKHAGAKTAEICVESHPSLVCATVQDDGRGFDVDLTRRTSDASKHLGIHGMQERAVRLKGTLTIESMPWGGTTISVRIPLTENSHD